MDMVAIGTLLTSLKTATDIAKFIRESDVSLERAELKLKLADLIHALADAKIDAASVQQEILDRDERIRELQATAKVKANLIWRQPCYFLKNEDGVEEAYCQHCWDSLSKLARLHTDGRGYFKCHVCNKPYMTEDRRKADRSAQDTSLQSHRRGPDSWMAR